MVDMVNSPPHYKSASGLECIDVTAFLPFCEGNAFKYLFRAGKKTDDALTDLRKAAWYVDKALSRIPEREWVPRNDTILRLSNDDVRRRASELAVNKPDNVAKAMQSIVDSTAMCERFEQAELDLQCAKANIAHEIARLEGEAAK